jgi:predicted ArsR family transcriptional regulator
MNEPSNDPTEKRRTDPVAAIALLDEPKRRRLYEYVTARRNPVGRDEAAAALGIGRELVAFHLDRLAAVGLLDIEYRRLGERRGPGAGRPAKLYKRTERELAVSYPARDYERAAEVFAEALDSLGGGEAKLAVEEVAHARGQASGVAARARVSAAEEGSGDEAVHPTQLRAALIELLSEADYRPQTDEATGAIRLESCPYHALTADHRDLTCGMNLAWAEGVLDGLGDAGLQANLAPEPGYCCVVFREAEAKAS